VTLLEEQILQTKREVLAAARMAGSDSRR